MITPALVILLIVVGWGMAAFAMLWGMLRIARHHHKPTPDVRQKKHSDPVAPPHTAPVSLAV